MAVISKGQTFATGDQVTASKLNNLADNATFASGAVDNVSTQLSGGAIIVRDGGITTAKIAPNALNGVEVTATGSIEPRTLEDRFADTVNVRDFGAVGDAVTDDYAAIQEAIDSLDEFGGTLFFPRGNYLVLSELDLNKPGVTLIGVGSGSMWDIDDINAGTTIQGGSTTGSVIRIRYENCSIKNIRVSSSAARYAAAINDTAANCNVGIRVEADDVGAPEGDVFHTNLDNVGVFYQPNSGILFVGRTNGSTLNNVSCSRNKKHGMDFDDGTATGRTNLVDPGYVTIYNGHTSRNSGYGLKIGGGTSTNTTYRFTVINHDSYNNNADLAFRENSAFYDSFINSDGSTFLNCAFDGSDIDGIPNSHGAVAVAGYGCTFIEPRLLSCIRAIRVVAVSGRTTYGAHFLNCHFRDVSATEPVTLDNGTRFTKITVFDPTSSSYSDLIDNNDQVGTDVVYGGIKRFSGVIQANSFCSIKQLTIEDNEATSILFSGTFTYGSVMIASNTDSSGNCLAAFRVGTSPFASVMAGEANVNGTTGILGGTTGSDNKLTLGAHTDGRLYIENRTGAQRTLYLTFFNLSSDSSLTNGLGA